MNPFPAALAAACLFALPAVAGTPVSVGHFDSVSLKGGGHVVVRHGERQSVTLIKGSTQYTTFRLRRENQLEIRACEGDCPRHYELEIEIVTPDLDAAAIEGGGHIVAENGFPGRREISAAVEGGGDLDLSALKAEKVSAAVSGGGHIAVTALHDLSAAVEGGGSIVYHGNPQVSSAIDGGGSVSKASR
ncbi:MAG TPA: DUF2807 domain-containing protein [Rhizomicrobium sp.]|jgi:hypothetical protein|nr:DUF2807 domain-containing protein [Rhizomicrobium sp.]